ncbi:MAG: retropepsin-like aspartic protease [Planctomycetota bacterium]|jgi:hypothetical protein
MMKLSKVLMAGVYFAFVVCSSIALGQDRLTIDTRINGKDAVFAFDTGTSVRLVVFEQTVERFNLNTSEQKPLKIAHFEFEIGKSTKKAEAVVIDSPPVQVDGLIGCPALQGNIWAVQWSTGTLIPIPSIPEQAKSWIQINLSKDVPVLAFAEGQGGKGLIFIDTGDSGGVSLSGARWKRWLKEHPDAPMTLSSGWSPALGGIYVGRQSWSDRLDLGALTIPGVTVREAGHKWSRLEAVIGLEALSHFEVVLDLRENRIYLKARNGDYIEPEYNRLGATFPPKSLDSVELVAKVLRSSPGYRCGIRNGDILLRVDDVDMTKWRDDPSIWKRRFWYGEPGTQYNLKIKRNGKKIDLQVRLEEIFPVGRNKKKQK